MYIYPFVSLNMFFISLIFLFSYLDSASHAHEAVMLVMTTLFMIIGIFFMGFSYYKLTKLKSSKAVSDNKNETPSV